MTTYEGLFYCNNLGKISERRAFREELREILEPMELYHKKLIITDPRPQMHLRVSDHQTLVHSCMSGSDLIITDHRPQLHIRSELIVTDPCL